jgi:hypothetical protein
MQFSGFADVSVRPLSAEKAGSDKVWDIAKQASDPACEMMDLGRLIAADVFASFPSPGANLAPCVFGFGKKDCFELPVSSHCCSQAFSHLA